MERQIKKTVLISSNVSVVWDHISNPDLVKQWMGDAELKLEIITDWKVGSSIVIKGSHYGTFENRGQILKSEPGKVLQYTHLSSVSRLTDSTRNYSVITFSLEPVQEQTRLSITIENFPTETIFKHLELYWKTTAGIIKEIIETTRF